MSKRKDRRDVGKQAFWRDAVKRQAASGLSVRGYCRQEGVSEASFYAWRRELRLRRQEAKAKADRRFSGRGRRSPSAQRAGEPTPHARFVPLTIHHNAGIETGLELVLSGGIVLRLPRSTTPATIATLVVELERHGC